MSLKIISGGDISIGSAFERYYYDWRDPFYDPPMLRLWMMLGRETLFMLLFCPPLRFYLLFPPPAVVLIAELCIAAAYAAATAAAVAAAATTFVFPSYVNYRKFSFEIFADPRIA